MKAFFFVHILITIASASFILHPLFLNLGEAYIAENGDTAVSSQEVSSLKTTDTYANPIKYPANRVAQSSSQHEGSTQCQAASSTDDNLRVYVRIARYEESKRSWKDRFQLWILTRFTQGRATILWTNFCMWYIFSTRFLRQEGIFYRMWMVKLDLRLAVCQDICFTVMFFVLPLLDMEINVICYSVVVGVFVMANIVFGRSELWYKRVYEKNTGQKDEEYDLGFVITGNDDDQTNEIIASEQL